MQFDNIVPHLIIIVTIFGISLFFISKRSIEPKIESSQEGISVRSIESKDLNEVINSDVTVLDVRTEEEFESGHLSKAINIDYYLPSFASELNKLDKSKTYFVYCRSGNRSDKTIDLMKQMGFKNLINLSTGIISIDKGLLCTGNC